MSARPTRRLVLGTLTSLVLLGASGYGHAQAAPTRVKLETSLGDITLELDAAKAPQTVANFLRYVDRKHYEGTVFHRVIPGFMVQGGGFDKDMNQKETDKPIALESRNGLKNVTGSVAMARTGDPNSATSQFFINVVDNNGLDYPGQDGFGYAVFGKVIDGMEVVSKIVAAPTGSYGPHQNVPRTPIVIRKATLLAADAKKK